MQSGKKKVRRTFAQLFIDELKKLSDGGKKLVSNAALREELGWDQRRYSQIKDQLKNAGDVIVGRGQGGSVGISSVPGSRALNIFISYSHVDESHKDELLKHLSPLKRRNLIAEWHDRKLKAGEEWGPGISKNLEAADIILLLVSIDFINSKYCYDIELEKALEQHESGQSVVIPVILRSCLWQHTPFARLQALPRDGRAVSSWADIDEALANVAEGIRISAESLLENK